MEFSKYIDKVLKEDKKFRDLYNNKDEDFKIQVANLITEARIHFGYTQEALAKKVGTKQSSIARMERGSTLPSLTFLQRIATALGTYLTGLRFGFMEHNTLDISSSYNIETNKELIPEIFSSNASSYKTATMSPFINQDMINH